MTTSIIVSPASENAQANGGPRRNPHKPERSLMSGIAFLFGLDCSRLDSILRPRGPHPGTSGPMFDTPWGHMPPPVARCSIRQNAAQVLLLFDIDGTLLLRASESHRRALLDALTLVYGLEEPGSQAVAAAGRTDTQIARDIALACGLPAG
ncbi:MAG TPA: hypothetical protein VIJ11_08625, partial [Galbitalea sp.]